MAKKLIKDLNEVRFLGFDEVSRIAGNASRITLWRWMKAGLFPKSRKLGPGNQRAKIGWVESEVRLWARKKAAK